MTYQNQWGAKDPATTKKGFRIHLLVFVLAIPASWIVWYFTDRTYLWPLWSMSAWAIGVVFHYLSVFVFKKAKQN